MLSNNLKRIRKSKGLSQEELAIKLNVVTISLIKGNGFISSRFGYVNYIGR